MIRLALAFFLGLTTSFTFSQKCEVQTDPFSNSVVISYKYGKSIVLEAIEDKVTLKYYLKFVGEVNAGIPMGSDVSFKLENGDLVKLQTMEDVKPVTQVLTAEGIAIIWTEYIVSFSLTEEHLKSFAESKMTHVRYPDLKGDYITEESRKRWAKRLNKGALCILDNL